MNSPSEKQDQYDQYELDRMADEGGPPRDMVRAERAVVGAVLEEGDIKGEQRSPAGEDGKAGFDKVGV